MAGMRWPNIVDAGAGEAARPAVKGRGGIMRVVLAQPRGFCAGVERAIEIVERALEKYGAPKAPILSTRSTRSLRGP